MKVKIGDKFYDGREEPIMIILNDIDKENIAKLRPEFMKYCEFPQGSDPDEIKKWMNIK